MRRLALVVVCCGLVQLFTPAPAQAWYEWIDQLSGPGPWQGFHFDVRIACFENPVANDTVKQASDRARDDDDRLKVKRVIGFEASCPADRNGYKKRSSVGLEFRVVHADPDPAYARGEKIQLVTIEPSFSRSIFEDPSWNFIDIGAAGGMYWFSSKGFSSFSGVVIEPFRVDLHLPPFDFTSSRSKGEKIGLAIAQSFVFRGAIMIFPAGFEPNVFAASTRQTARRIPSELVFAKSLFFDISPLLRLKAQ